MRRRHQGSKGKEIGSPDYSRNTYAFTDYRSQGQTFTSIIVDLAKPPSGGELSLFNIYVTLSRSSGRKTIRLLRQFDETTLYKGIDNQLTVEDD